MPSLIFHALDRHVVDGRADHPAIEDERGSMSYAQLLHESAALASGLRTLGIADGTPVSIELSGGRELAVVVLACARIGAVPADGAAFRITGTPPVVHTVDTEVPWDVAIRAGRTDPASAPESDPEGYAELMRSGYSDVFTPLMAGGTIG